VTLAAGDAGKLVPRQGVPMKRWVGLVLGLLLGLRAEADPAGQRVLQCVRQNLPQSGTVREIEMVAVDRSGAARTMQGRVYARAEDQAGRPSPLDLVVRFDAPRDLSGTAYLVRQAADGGDDQMYLFLPSLQRVRRISAGSARASLPGGSFGYADFQQLRSAFGSSDATLEGSRDLGGREAQLLSIGTAGTASPYSRVRSWIDRQTCVPLQAEFYVGTVVKKRFQAAADALRRSGRYWYLAESRMQDLGDGSTTTLRIGKLVSGAGIPGSYFQPGSFFLAN
jgi:hypothetical protein